MLTLGRVLLILGFAITISSLLVLIFGNLAFPRGSIIGDWEYHSRNVHIYVPLITCAIVSGVLTLALWLAKRR